MLKSVLAAAALTAMPVLASAATISVSVFNAAAYNGSFTGANKVTEDFEALGMSKGEGQVGAALSTNVGTIASLGGIGTGGTVQQLGLNSGTQLALRDGTVFGRTNTTPNGAKWFLDSNDTWGMTWNVVLSGGRAFTALAFSLMDANDTGAKLRVTTGLSKFETSTVGPNGNKNTKLVEINFGSAVTSATVTLGNYKTVGGTVFKLNDGFSIDGLQVVQAPAPVPVPASMMLMASGLAGLAMMRRRNKSA